MKLIKYESAPNNYLKGFGGIALGGLVGAILLSSKMDYSKIKSDRYYVNMMISWAIAESLYINFDQTIKFLEAKI